MKDLRGQEVMYIKKSDLEKIREFFLKKEKVVILSMINVGVNVALRISDLKNLKFEDINGDWNIRIKERKTKKYKYIKLNSICRKSITELKKFYISVGISPTGYIFKSFNRSYLKKGLDKPLSTVSINRYLGVAKRELNISYPIGTHSLRKTWGYFVYKRTKNLAIIMKILNHSSISQTLKYIGIEQEDLNLIYENCKI